MPALAELQGAIRDFVVAGDPAALSGRLVGGRDPLQRLAIHRRHYRASLAQAIAGRFPALVWLLGSEPLHAAALAFVAAHPPTAPCIAEYGEAFPAFLAARLDGRVPYAEPLGRLEWLVGRASVAVDMPPADMAALALLPPDLLPGAVLTLQPGAGFLVADWPVDHLMRVWLDASHPGGLTLDAEPVALEVGGQRGAFTFRRLPAATVRFRAALAAGQALGVAAAAAGDDFDIGAALAALFTDRLVVGVTPGDAP